MEKVYNFMCEICKNRDYSHGIEHMKNVYERSMIYTHELNLSEEFKNIVMIVSLLHDVADHKYDKNCELKLKLKEFLKRYEKHELIMSIIDDISFSKEYRKNTENTDEFWIKKYGEYAIVRNIVSDADKIEALGKSGLERCISYQKEKNPELNEQEIKKLVKQHAIDKLSFLYKYIRTEPGKKDAEIYQKEFNEELEKYLIS